MNGFGATDWSAAGILWATSNGKCMKRRLEDGDSSTEASGLPTGSDLPATSLNTAFTSLALALPIVSTFPEALAVRSDSASPENLARPADPALPDDSAPPDDFALPDDSALPDDLAHPAEFFNTDLELEERGRGPVIVPSPNANGDIKFKWMYSLWCWRGHSAKRCWETAGT